MTKREFTEEAVQSSHAFRSIMQAMARPGRILELHTTFAAPEPLDMSAAAVARTLFDFQTLVWLGPSLRSPVVQNYLRFHTGAPLTEERGIAHFALTLADDALRGTNRFMLGTDEYPDRSTTLVIQVAGFLPGGVELSGPGIPSRISFGAVGLDQSFWQEMAENHARFPVGIDVIFAAPGQVAALPRSTAVHFLENA